MTCTFILTRRHRLCAVLARDVCVHRERDRRLHLQQPLVQRKRRHDLVDPLHSRLLAHHCHNRVLREYFARPFSLPSFSPKGHGLIERSFCGWDRGVGVQGMNFSIFPDIGVFANSPVRGPNPSGDIAFFWKITGSSPRPLCALFTLPGYELTLRSLSPSLARI